MDNTRQVLKLKLNCSAEEANNLINNYLNVNKFIQTDYNGEKVLKLNSLWAKQSPYKTYIKIFLTTDELIVVGWVNYKEKEYGFDDVLDFEDTTKQGNWEPIRQLYSIFYSLAYNFKIDNNVYCEKLLVNDINIPEIQNLFVPTVNIGEDKTYFSAKAGKIILIVGLSLIVFCVLMAVMALALDL